MVCARILAVLLVWSACLGCGPPPLEWPSLAPVHLEARPPARQRFAFPSTYESFLRGQVAYHEEDYGAAHRHFRAALRMDPESSYIHGWVARALLALDRIPQAREAVDEALELDGCNEFALCTAASILVEADEFDSAMRTLRRAIECEPRQPEAYYQLATLLEQQSSPRRAVEVYRSLLEVRPTQARAHAELARVALAEGASAEALRHLNRLLELEPWRNDAIRELAEASFARGETATARAMAEIVIGRLPRDDATRRLLIEILLASGDSAGAARHIDLLRPDETSATELAELSRLFLAARRFERAEREAARALAIDPSHPLAGAVRVGALRGLGQVDRAVEAYGRLLTSRPETDAAAREAALALWESGRTEPARALLVRRLEEASRSPRSRELLARLHESESRGDEAEAILRAGELPEDRAALGALLLRQGRAREASVTLAETPAEDESVRQLVLLGRALLERDDGAGTAERFDAVEAVARRARERTGHDAGAWALVGALASARGRHQEGLTSLRRADSFRPGSIWIMTYLARALNGAGDCTEAALVARRAMRLGPTTRERLPLEELAGVDESSCASSEVE